MATAHPEADADTTTMEGSDIQTGAPINLEGEPIIRDFGSVDLPTTSPVTQTTRHQYVTPEPGVPLVGPLEERLPTSELCEVQLCAALAILAGIQHKVVNITRKHADVLRVRQDLQLLLLSLRQSAAECDSMQHGLADSQKTYMEDIFDPARNPLLEVTRLTNHYAEILVRQEALAEKNEVWQTTATEITKIMNKLQRTEQSFTKSLETLCGSVRPSVRETSPSREPTRLDPVSTAYIQCIDDIRSKMQWLVRLLADYAVWAKHSNRTMDYDVPDEALEGEDYTFVAQARTKVFQAVEAADRALHAAEAEDKIAVHEHWEKHQQNLFDVLTMVMQPDPLLPDNSVRLDIRGVATISAPLMSQFSHVPRFDLHGLATAIREGPVLRSVRV
ncbi:hypothetical protein LTR56_011214 [Elasticomyces elasticus]|nr:hypothetical protein LTR56_011214 [Elasticomyces elasticus]KAK3650422.1 hypothetical protein LTR22_012512 [Elasticomyces elasticus]KAK4921845.1 hypothetical protein LTR49_010784 [Elasticomyces elasticus]KAK5751429.1 hypothetical protein LTS12_018517 [Elasticomyces elasticus]